MRKKNQSPEEKARREKIRELLELTNIGSLEDSQGLFKETIAEFMESGLDAELDEECGYSRYDYRNKHTDNSRNGHSNSVTLANGANKWYDSYVEYALRNSIINQDYASVINKPIDRMTYVSIFFHALPENAFPERNTIPDNAIPDVKAGDAYSNDIYAFYRTGILNGNDAEGTFHPTSKIKRSEVATILVRMMDSSSRVNGPVDLR